MAEIIQRDAIAPGKSSATVGTALTTILGPVDLLRFDKKAFTVKNTGGTAFNAGQLQATSILDPVATTGVGGGPSPAPSTADADWETIDNTTFATLGAGAVKSLQIFSDSRRFWRVRASVAAGTTTADGYVTAGAI